MQGARFPGKGFDEHANGHARGEGVRVDDDVRLHAGFAEGEVDGGPALGEDTLLSVTGRELITDVGVTRDAELYGEGVHWAVEGGFVSDEADLFDVGVFVALVGEDAVGGGHGGVRGDVVVDGDGVALFDLHADDREAVHVDAVEPFALDVEAAETLAAVFLGRLGIHERRDGFLALLAVAEAEETFGLLSAGFLVLELVLFNFIDGSVSEAALERGFVDYHGVVHVVAGVGDDGNDGVHAVGEVVETVVVVEGRADNRGLTGLEAVGLVVGAVADGGAGGTHRLFSHLTLVHVSGRLVEVAEGGHVGDDREDVRGIELHMGGLAGGDLGLRDSDGHVRLLEGANDVLLLEGKVLDGSDHSRLLREEEDTRVLSTSRHGNVTDLQLQRNVVRTLNLPMTKSLNDHLRLLDRAPTDDSSIQLYALGGRRGPRRGSRGKGAQGRQSRSNTSRIYELGGDPALVCKVVKQTARSSIRSVDGA